MSDDRITIIEDVGVSKPGGDVPPWLLLSVDDDDSVHQATRFALGDFSFEDRRLEIISAYSAKEARQVIAEQENAAVILLDVVMESEDVGLDLLRWIRNELANSRARIVLRTDQPGFAPEFQVVRDYDINDHKNKSEMTAAILSTTVYSALRSFRDIVSSGRRLLAMAESVLEFSDSGDEMSLEFEPFDLKALIGEFFDHQSADTAVEPDRDAGESVGPGRLMLRADRHAVQIMLMNAVSTALRHNPPNCSVRLTAHQLSDGGFVLSVIDNGGGMTVETERGKGTTVRLHFPSDSLAPSQAEPGKTLN